MDLMGPLYVMYEKLVNNKVQSNKEIIQYEDDKSCAGCPTSNEEIEATSVEIDFDDEFKH